jgi:hypothetical protein
MNSTAGLLPGSMAWEAHLGRKKTPEPLEMSAENRRRRNVVVDVHHNLANLRVIAYFKDVPTDPDWPHEIKHDGLVKPLIPRQPSNPIRKWHD